MTEQPQKPRVILVCSECGKPVSQPYGEPGDVETTFYHCVFCVQPVRAVRKEIPPGKAEENTEPQPVDSAKSSEDTKTRAPITSDVPPGMPQEPISEETRLARQRLYEEIAEAESREFEYDICPNDRGLLRVIGYDEKGQPNRWICPECKKETTTTMKQKYKPQPKMYIEFSTIIGGKNKELPLRAQEIANDLKANYLFKTDRETKQIYRYDDEKRVWRDDGATYLMELLPQIVGDRNSEALYKNTLHCLKAVTHEETKPSRAVIAVKNGFLHLDKKALIAPTPNEHTTTRIPHKYNPEAKCPKILKALIEVIGEKQLPLLQEAIGNTLIMGMLFQKITIFIGGGGNGKGLVLALITYLLGPENVSNVTLQALCSDKYELAHCYRKLANLGRDIPQTKIGATGAAKMMSGDDPMTMQHKYGHPFDAAPDDLPKQFYSCNQLPPSNDDTDAWYRRQNLITFNNQFIPGKNAIPRFADKLAEDEEEMSGFLNFVLEGRDRILKNWCFSANENIEENRERYIKNSDPATAYIEANLVYEENKFVVEKELWSNVGVWCKDNGIAPPKNKGFFTQTLTKKIPQVTQTTQRVGGKAGIHVYMNVQYKVKTDSDQNSKGSGSPQKQLDTPQTSEKEEKKSQCSDRSDCSDHSYTNNLAENLSKNKSGNQPATAATPATNTEHTPEETIDAYCQGGCCNCDTRECPKPIYSIPSNAKAPKSCPKFTPVMPSYDGED